MEKVYLLLRNNYESGPFNYAQLLNQSLVPTDLIWIEGQSLSWMTPAELEDYNKKKAPYVSVTSVSAVVPAAVQLPPLVQEPVYYRDSRFFSPKVVKYDRQSFLEDKTSLLPEDGGVEIRIHKKGVRLVSLDQLAGAAFIALVLTTAWFGRHQFFAEKQQTLSVVSPAAFMSEQSFAAKKEVLEPTISPIQNIQDSVITSPSTTEPIKRSGPVGKKNMGASLPNQPVAATKTQDIKSLDVAQPVSHIPKIEDASLIKEEATSEVIKSEPEPTKDNAISAGDEVKKKKSLGKAIKGIFRKKNKDLVQDL